MPNTIKPKVRAKVIPIQPVEQVDLYEVRQKIYPRAVHGLFAKWRWALVILTQLVFYGTLWLPWHGRQAVLFNLVERKFYIFGWVFWPQDFILLAALLVVSAFSLFMFTAIGGRLWCGYACPQTVYTEIFLWIERWVEGDRPAQIKLDQAPLSARKLRLKTTKHGLWLLISLWTGITFVGYFTPIHSLLHEVFHQGLGPWETFWIGFYGLATYGNAGWMREQVCKYMCPYARFQSVMFDRDTLVIHYDDERGEKRGARGKNVDPKSKGLGDCVDCGICVQVCPTGIDIRDGLQYECIGCAACIDACDQVMEKMNYPKGLIRYTTENMLEHKVAPEQAWRRLFRPRVLIYGTILLGITTAMFLSVLLRNPLKVNVMRDRNTLAVEAEDGTIENVYSLQLINMDEKPHQVRITVQGLPGLKLKINAKENLLLAPTDNRVIPVRVGIDPEYNERGARKIEFVIEALDQPKMIRHERSSFIGR